MYTIISMGLDSCLIYTHFIINLILQNSVDRFSVKPVDLFTKLTTESIRCRCGYNVMNTFV